MCVEIEIEGGFYQTVGQLSSFLVTLHFQPDTALEEKVPNNCLCWIDLAVTAEANGFKYIDTGDRYYAVFERK